MYLPQTEITALLSKCEVSPALWDDVAKNASKRTQSTAMLFSPLRIACDSRMAVCEYINLCRTRAEALQSRSDET